MQIWDAARSKQVRMLRGHSARVGCLAWNGTTLATGGRDNHILTHDVRVREHLTATLRAHSQEVRSTSVFVLAPLHIQHDPLIILTAAGDMLLACSRALKGAIADAQVCGLKWSPSGQQLASGGNDNLLHIYDANSISNSTYVHRIAEHQARTDPPLHTFLYLNGLRGRSEARARSTNYQCLCSMRRESQTSAALFCSVKGFGHFAVLTHAALTQAAVKALAWCPFQSNLLASGGGTADRCIKFWNTHTGALQNSIDTHSQARSRPLLHAAPLDTSTICSLCSAPPQRCPASVGQSQAAYLCLSEQGQPLALHFSALHRQLPTQIPAHMPRRLPAGECFGLE